MPNITRACRVVVSVFLSAAIAWGLCELLQIVVKVAGVFTGGGVAVVLAAIIAGLVLWVTKKGTWALGTFAVLGLPAFLCVVLGKGLAIAAWVASLPFSFPIGIIATIIVAGYLGFRNQLPFFDRMLGGGGAPAAA